MNAWLQHLPVLPIVVPLLAGALLLLFAESRRWPRLLITLFAILTQLAAAITMVWLTTDSVPDTWSRGIGPASCASSINRRAPSPARCFSRARA